MTLSNHRGHFVRTAGSSQSHWPGRLVQTADTRLSPATVGLSLIRFPTCCPCFSVRVGDTAFRKEPTKQPMSLPGLSGAVRKVQWKTIWEEWERVGLLRRALTASVRARGSVPCPRVRQSRNHDASGPNLGTNRAPRRRVEPVFAAHWGSLPRSWRLCELVVKNHILHTYV